MTNALSRPDRSPDLAPGVYVHAAEADDGQGVEFFLCDPPTALNTAAQKTLGARPIHRAHPGAPETRMSLVPRDGGPHVVDWVPQKRYPNVADLVEEGRRVGFHRPCGLTPPELAQLTARSLLLLVHAKGHIQNWTSYGQLPGSCPKTMFGGQTDGHDPFTVPDSMCCLYWWHDVEGGHPLETGEKGAARTVDRATVRGTYRGRRAPDQVEPRYAPAIVARLPVGGITVVGHDDEGQRGRQARALMDAAWAAGLDVRTLD